MAFRWVGTEQIVGMLDGLALATVANSQATLTLLESLRGG